MPSGLNGIEPHSLSVSIRARARISTYWRWNLLRLPYILSQRQGRLRYMVKRAVAAYMVGR